MRKSATVNPPRRGAHSRHAALAGLLALLLWLAGQSAPASAQTAVEFNNVAAFVQFGQQITFQAVVSPEAAIQEAYLALQPQGVEALLFPVEVNQNNEIVYLLDLTHTTLRPFSQVQYAFRLRLANGESVASPQYTFDYVDTRFDWQTIANDSFTVYWYDRDLTFGQLALNSAQMGLETIQNIIPVQLDRPVSIYTYNTAADLKGALPGAQPWIAGQSAPDLGIVFLSIPIGAEEQLEMERQLPHELMHVMLYRMVGEKAANLPVWLLEGLASTAETSPNPEYASALAKSAAEDKLIPLENLCGAFPRDASGAFLAYAESASFVRYLHRSYGASALRGLVQQYQDGLGCAEGVQTALGASLTQLEYRWKQQELRLDAESLIFRNLLPYLLLFLVLFGAAALTTVLTAQHLSRPRRVSEE